MEKNQSDQQLANGDCRIETLKKVCLAEKEGFEPSVGSPLRLISSQVHSTTLPLLLIRCRLSKQEFYQVRSSAKPPM